MERSTEGWTGKLDRDSRKRLGQCICYQTRSVHLVKWKQGLTCGLFSPFDPLRRVSIYWCTCISMVQSYRNIKISASKGEWRVFLDINSSFTAAGYCSTSKPRRWKMIKLRSSSKNENGIIEVCPASFIYGLSYTLVLRGDSHLFWTYSFPSVSSHAIRTNSRLIWRIS